MAFVVKRAGTSSLCEKFRDPDTGKWRNRVVVCLGGAETPEAALMAYQGEEQALVEEIAATDAECANPRWGYLRQSRLAGLQYRERLGEVRDRIQKLEQYLAGDGGGEADIQPAGGKVGMKLGADLGASVSGGPRLEH